MNIASTVLKSKPFSKRWSDYPGAKDFASDCLKEMEYFLLTDGELTIEFVRDIHKRFIIFAIDNYGIDFSKKAISGFEKTIRDFIETSERLMLENGEFYDFSDVRMDIGFSGKNAHYAQQYHKSGQINKLTRLISSSSATDAENLFNEFLASVRDALDISALIEFANKAYRFSSRVNLKKLSSDNISREAQWLCLTANATLNKELNPDAMEIIKKAFGNSFYLVNEAKNPDYQPLKLIVDFIDCEAVGIRDKEEKLLSILNNINKSNRHVSSIYYDDAIISLFNCDYLFGEKISDWVGKENLELDWKQRATARFFTAENLGNGGYVTKNKNVPMQLLPLDLNQYTGKRRQELAFIEGALNRFVPNYNDIKMYLEEIKFPPRDHDLLGIGRKEIGEMYSLTIRRIFGQLDNELNSGHKKIRRTMALKDLIMECNSHNGKHDLMNSFLSYGCRIGQRNVVREVLAESAKYCDIAKFFEAIGVDKKEAIQKYHIGREIMASDLGI